MKRLGWVVGLSAWLSGCPLSSGGTGDKCKTHSDCDADLVCASSKCGTPYARNWRLTIQSAHISPTDSSGNSWDGDGSAPDPYVTVNQEATELLRTQVVDNTLTPTWNESVVVALNNSTRIQISLWDQDFLLPQEITHTVNSVITAAELKQGEVVAFAPTGAPDAGPSDKYTSLTYRWDLVE